LITMTGLAAFLLSDIISFGLNSDHNSVLAGLEDQDPIKSIMSIINWNEKNIKPAVCLIQILNMKNSKDF